MATVGAPAAARRRQRARPSEHSGSRARAVGLAALVTASTSPISDACIRGLDAFPPGPAEQNRVVSARQATRPRLPDAEGLHDHHVAAGGVEDADRLRGHATPGRQVPAGNIERMTRLAVERMVAHAHAVPRGPNERARRVVPGRRRACGAPNRATGRWWRWTCRPPGAGMPGRAPGRRAGRAPTSPREERRPSSTRVIARHRGPGHRRERARRVGDRVGSPPRHAARTRSSQRARGRSGRHMAATAASEAARAATAALELSRA